MLYLIIDIIGVPLLIILIISIVKRIRKRNFIKSKALKFILLLVTIIVFPIIFVNLFLDYKAPIYDNEKIEYNERYKYYLAQNRVYSKMLRKDPLNLDLNFKYVNSIKKHIDKNHNNHFFNLRDFKKSDIIKDIESYYDYYVVEDDSLYKDIGCLFYGILQLNLNEDKKAIKFLNQVSNKDMKYLSYALGVYYLKTFKFKKSEENLLKSISKSEAKELSYNRLARLYYYFSKDEKLKSLIYNPEANRDIRIFYKRAVYMRSNDFVNYWKAIFIDSFKSSHILGIIASLLILIVWFFYLRQVDIYEPEKWHHVLLTLLLGMTTIWFVFPINDFIWERYQYYPSYIPVYEFFQIVLSIGVIEELVKIIPVLIILKFSNAINEPYDYILYASISALGFAFVENVGYIEEGSLYNINARALTATIAHMVFSSTIAYGLMLAKYGHFKSKIILFAVFFVIASLMHGFYDFWLMTKWSIKFEWISILFLLFGVHVWFLYENNTLNISNFYDKNIHIENDKLKYYLIISLVSIFMYSYVVDIYTQGSGYAIYKSQRNIFIYGGLILYFAFSLSRFEIVRGYLAPLSIGFSFIIPKINHIADFSGQKVKIGMSKRYKLNPEYEFLKQQFPKLGVLESRIVIDGILDAYIVKLESSYLINEKTYDKIIVFPKKYGRHLNESGNVLVYLLFATSDDIFEKSLLTKNDFEFAGWGISKKIIDNLT